MTMNAGELIRELAKYPPETPVFYDDYEKMSGLGFDIAYVVYHEAEQPWILLRWHL